MNTAQLYNNIVRMYPKLAFASDGWRFTGYLNGNMKLEKGKTKLVLDSYHAFCLLTEVRAWKRLYLPSFSLNGKTILDVGSGGGETAALFFEAGASKVIMVESDPTQESFARQNAKANGWSIDYYAELFSPKHFNLDFGWGKVDCEGGESCLLSSDVKPPFKPFVIELHPAILVKEVYDSIISKFGLLEVSEGWDAETGIWRTPE